MCVQKANTHTHTRGTHSSIGSYISIGKHEEVYVVPRSPGGAVQQCNYLVVRWQSRNRFIISFAIEFQFIALLHTPYRVHGVYILGIALCECVPSVDFSLNFYGIINENIMQCALEINERKLFGKLNFIPFPYHIHSSFINMSYFLVHSILSTSKNNEFIDFKN